MATKILFQIAAEDLGVATKLEAIRDRQKEINTAIREAKKIGKPYDGLIQELAKTRVETGKLREEQRNLNKEFKAAQFPKDSVIGMRVEYGKLTDQINKLSAAERNSSFGQGLIKRGKSLKTEINSVEQSIGNFTGNVGNYKTAISGLAKILPLIGVGLGVGEIVNATREYEKMFAVLRQATGSDINAKTIFAGLKEFAAETPFQLQEVVGAFVKLENRNFKPTIDQLRTMGDIAASGGKTIDQFVEAILDAQTGEFERLKEFGIVARKNGDILNVTFRGQATTIKNTSSAISEYLLSIGKLPGIQGTAVAVSKTLDGSISNLQDGFTQLATTVGGAGGFLKGFIDLIGSAVSGLNKMVAVPLSEELQSQQVEFNALIGILKDVNTSEAIRNSAIAELQKNYPEYIGNINLENASQTDLNKLLESGNLLFTKRIFLQQNEEKLVEFAKQKLSLERQLFEAQKDQQKLAQSGQSGTRAVTFNRNDGDRIQPTRGETSASRITALRDALEKTNATQLEFTSGQDELAKSLFAGADAATAARVEAKRLADERAKGGSDSKPKGKDKDFGEIGSISFLREEISKLQKQIDTTSADSPLLKGLLVDLKKVDIALSIAEAKINALKNPAGPDASEFDQANAGLLSLGGIKQSDADRLKEDLQKLASDLAESVGVTLPVTVDTEGADAAFFELQRKQNDIDDKASAERLEKREQDKEELINQAFNTASTIAGGVFEIQQNAQAAEQSAAQAALDTKLARDLLKAKGNAKKEALIRADYENKKAALEKEGAEKRKKIAKVEAIIQGALAVIRALAVGNFILAAAAAIATGVQVAVINSQEFAGGGQVTRQKSGMIKQEPNAPTTGGGDNILAYLQNKEVVLNREQQHRLQQRAGRSILADIGVPGINITNAPRLVSGGAIDFIPQSGFRSNFEAANREAGLSIQSVAEFSDNQTRQLGSTLGVLIAGEVSKQVRIALGQGLNDANRRLEREASLETNRRG